MFNGPIARGPSLGPVVEMTSKLLMSIRERLSNALAAKRSSGQTEMEKKLPLSATIAPYFVRSQAYEWTALTYALQTWLEKIWPETPFLDLGMFQTRPISLYSLAARLAQNVPAVYG